MSGLWLGICRMHSRRTSQEVAWQACQGNRCKPHSVSGRNESRSCQRPANDVLKRERMLTLLCVYGLQLQMWGLPRRALRQDPHRYRPSRHRHRDHCLRRCGVQPVFPRAATDVRPATPFPRRKCPERLPADTAFDHAGGGGEDGGQPCVLRARPGFGGQPLHARAALGALVPDAVRQQVRFSGIAQTLAAHERSFDSCRSDRSLFPGELSCEQSTIDNPVYTLLQGTC